jgi:SWI/SNF and RSC complexes subunit Ssr4 C-terminal
MPPVVPQQHYQQPYMNRALQGHLPAAYRPPQPPLPGPGVKRVKIEEEEEDDTFVPKDVAAQRFVRWTEWMEEILSSGYNISMPC